MARLASLLVVGALVSAAAAGAASRPARAAHGYSVAQVVRAFESQGLALRPKSVPASARYTRLASSSPLRVVVFRSARATARTIEVVLGSRPSRGRACRGCIVVRFGGLRASHKPAVWQVEVANVAVVNVASSRLDARVSAALARLRS